MFKDMTRPLVVFDIESTGTNALHDRIIELAAVKIHRDGTEEKKSWLLNPGCDIPVEASKIHGYYLTDSEEENFKANVKSCPTFAQKAKEIFDFFKDCDLGGFNSDRFDIPCLESELKRAAKEYDLERFKPLHVDAQRIYHMMEPRTLVAAVRYYLNRDHIGAHGAIDDTLATVEVLKEQLRKYPELPRTVQEMDGFLRPQDPENVDREGKFKWKVVNGAKKVIINFGANRGLLLEGMKDSYLEWMLRGDFSEDVKAVVRKEISRRSKSPASINNSLCDAFDKAFKSF